MEVIQKHYLKRMILVVMIAKNKKKEHSSTPSLTTLLTIFESYKVFYHYEAIDLILTHFHHLSSSP
jgi:hypothetical protein